MTRRSFMSYLSTIVGVLSFGSLSLDAKQPVLATVDTVFDHMGEHFDPDGWL